MDNLYQANAVAYLPLNLNVNHLRVIMAIIYHLQETIKAGLKQTVPEQVADEPSILIIPVGDFHLGKCTGTRLRNCLDDLTGLGTHDLSISIISKTRPVRTSIIEDYEFPLYAHEVTLYLIPEVVTLFTNTRAGYFSYSFNLALSLTSKYTLRLYWLVCSWRNRGGFVIQLDELRRILCLGTAYNRFDNIAARILQPAQNELRERFPVWFLYKYCPGKEPQLAFKIRVHLSPAEQKQLRADTYDTCFHLLAAAGMSSALPTLDPVFVSLDPADYRPFLHHLTKILAYIRTHTISNPTAYLKASLESWIADWTLHFQDD